MRGNPIIRQASTRPYARSGPLTDIPRPEPLDAAVEQQDQQRGAGRVWSAPPTASAETLEGIAAELAELLSRRQDPVREWLPSSIWHRSSVQYSDLWRDQLLAEIEELAGELNKKVARFSSMRAVQPSDEATEPADTAAVAWIHQTLEDIAATALGLEIASREAFLQAGMPEEQHLEADADEDVESDEERRTGTSD